jgi:hypothetical protein
VRCDKKFEYHFLVAVILAFDRLKDDFKTERLSWENVLLRESFEAATGGGRTVLLETYIST